MRNTLLTLTLASACLAGCATLPPSLSGNYRNSADIYTPGQAQQVQQVQLGTVLTVRSVRIAATAGQTGTGSALGAVVGGLLGHQIGHGRGTTLATAAGAIAGGVGGNLIGQHAYTQPGLEISVRLDNGQLVSLTQAEDVPIVMGERVQLVGGRYYGTPARVIPAQSVKDAR